MIKLIQILEKILKDKLTYKSIEYKDGFKNALEIVKIHGLQSNVIHQIKILEEENKKLKEEYEVGTKFFKERLEEKNNKINEFHSEIQKWKSKANQKNENILLHKEKEKDYKRRERIRKILLNKSKDDSEKVRDALNYLNTIKETII